MSLAEASVPRLGTVTKALYGLGALSYASKTAVLGLVLFFYNQLVGLDAPMVSLALMIALFIDAVWDPIAGQISDGTHTRLGRRHAYIYAAALPASVSFALIFMPPLGWSHAALFAYLLVFIVASRMLDSLVEIPNLALMPELSQDYDVRTRLVSWRYVFLTVVGRVLSTVLAFGVFLRGTRANPKFGQMNIAGYAPYAITMAVIALAAVLISALATQRFVPYMHRPQSRRPGLAVVAREVGAALSNGNFVALAVCGVFLSMAGGISAGLLFYFMTYFWELGSPQLFQLGLWAVPGSLAGLILAPWWARKMGKKPASVIVFFLAIFSTTIPISLRLLDVMPPNSSPWVLRILILDSIATGMLTTMGLIILTAMIPDVVEEIQVKTGQRSEGLLFAANSLFLKLTVGFSALLPGLLLAFVHFPRRASPGHVPQPVLYELALIYLPIVTVLNLCSASTILLYKIDRRQHEANLERLAGAAALTGETDRELDRLLEQPISPGDS